MDRYYVLLFLVVGLSLSACKKGTNEKVVQNNSNLSTPTETLTKASAKTSTGEPATPESQIEVANLDADLLVRLIEEGINREREANGLALLQRDDILMKAAKERNDYQNLTGVQTERMKQTSTRLNTDKINYYGSQFTVVGENTMFHTFSIQRFEGKFSIVTPDYQTAANDIVSKWVKNEEDLVNIHSSIFTNWGTSVAWNEDYNALFATQLFGVL